LHEFEGDAKNCQGQGMDLLIFTFVWFGWFYLLVLIHNVWKILSVSDGYLALFVWKLLLLCTCLRANSEDASSGEAPVLKKRKLDSFAALRDASAPDQRGSSFNSEEELSHYKAMQVAPASRSPLIFGNVSPLNFRSLLEWLAEYSAIQRVLHNQSVTSRSLHKEHDHWCPIETVCKTVESTELVRWGLREGFV